MSSTGSHLLRRDLSAYAGASNLSLNDKVLQLIKEGHEIYHLAFGQSPFPVPDKLVQGLCKHAGRNEYLSTKGL